MRFSPRFLLIWVLFAGCCTVLSARDLYVDNMGGDDRFDGSAQNPQGGSGGGPCRTIARALRSAQNGDRIILKNTGQPYRESITLQGDRHSGTQLTPFEIIGNGATLDGTTAPVGDRWEHVKGELFRYAPARKSHQVLYMDGAPANRIVSKELGLPKLAPLQWAYHNRHIYFRTEPERIPSQYKLRHASLPVGVGLYQVRNVIISDLIVQGYQLDGVNLHDSAFSCLLLGVTARGNARSGVSVGGASRAYLEECVLGDNGAAQLRIEGYSKTQLIKTKLLDNTAPKVVRGPGSPKLEQ